MSKQSSLALPFSFKKLTKHCNQYLCISSVNSAQMIHLKCLLSKEFMLVIPLAECARYTLTNNLTLSRLNKNFLPIQYLKFVYKHFSSISVYPFSY